MAKSAKFVEGLPAGIGGELKWFVWNTIWYRVNSGLADAWSGEPSADKRRAAQEDLGRVQKHAEAARATKAMAPATLECLKRQAESAGDKASVASLTYQTLNTDTVTALDAPSEISREVWARIVNAARLAAASISESAMAVSNETFHHWHRGQALEKEFERAWDQVYERPPAPALPELEKSVPPRPLTREWLQRYGGLKDDALPSQIREEEFTDLDEGMVSSCRLVWFTPAAGGKEQCYVAKRSIGGAAEHWTAGSLLTEFRFYDKVVRKDAWPNAVALLGKALQVPKLAAANWGPEGQETEGFLLLMERLTAPKWIRVDPDKGCEPAQALAAVTALGKMHAYFADDGELGALPFLGVKPLGGEGQFESGYSWCFMRSASELSVHLTPGAREACGRMMIAGVGRLVRRLTEPPLTLLHGDFKLENLRFAGAQVGAFDWGLVTRGRGAWDFAYFLCHALRPEVRQRMDSDLVRLYLDQKQRATAERKGSKSTGPVVTDKMRKDFESEVRSALLCVLGKLIIVLADYQGSDKVRRMLTRNLEWAGTAVDDWKSVQELA